MKLKKLLILVPVLFLAGCNQNEPAPSTSAEPEPTEIKLTSGKYMSTCSWAANYVFTIDEEAKKISYEYFESIEAYKNAAPTKTTITDYQYSYYNVEDSFKPKDNTVVLLDGMNDLHFMFYRGMNLRSIYMAVGELNGPRVQFNALVKKEDATFLSMLKAPDGQYESKTKVVTDKTAEGESVERYIRTSLDKGTIAVWGKEDHFSAADAIGGKTELDSFTADSIGSSTDRFFIREYDSTTKTMKIRREKANSVSAQPTFEEVEVFFNLY